MICGNAEEKKFKDKQGSEKRGVRSEPRWPSRQEMLLFWRGNSEKPESLNKNRLERLLRMPDLLSRQLLQTPRQSELEPKKPDQEQQ